MRPSIKRSLARLLIVGALALSAVGSHAMGGGGSNGPDAYIGIAGGHPAYGGGYDSVPGFTNQGGGYQANTDRQHGHGWRGVNGWYHQGY